MGEPGATSGSGARAGDAVPLMDEGLPVLAALAGDLCRTLGEDSAAVLLYRHGYRLGRSMVASRPDAEDPPSIPGVARITPGTRGEVTTGELVLGPDVLPAIRYAVAGYVAGFYARRQGAPRVCVETPRAGEATCAFTCGPVEAAGEAGQARARWRAPEAVPVAAGAGVLRARNETLARHNADLRAAYLARTEFLADVCHELRSPAGLILDQLEDLVAGANAASGPLRERLRLVRHNALRVLHLADSILDLTRLGSGRTTLSFRPVSLAPFLSDLAQVFRRGFERRGLTLDTILPQGLPPLPADPDALEKVVGNLLDNAMKQTPAGGRVTLRLRRYGGAQVIEVADTGPGIAEADLPHLFERYQHRGADAGVGIGLALVRELVVRLGGEVQVHSTRGQGTVFRVFLDESRREADPAPVVRSARGKHAARLVDADHDLTAVAEAVPPPGRQRILVVEDNAELRDYLVRLLGDVWEVEVAPDGIEALSRVEVAPPDLVLCDVMMPRLDGLTLTGRLRTMPATREVPVVLLTARGELEHRLRGFEAGADDYVVKPFAGRELVARLRVHLALRAAQAELRAYASRLERLVDDQVGRIVAQNRGLARANRELEDFLTIASHDLKSPLVSIAGFTGILEEHVGAGAAPPVRLALDRIAFNVDWMQRLIEGLLSLASVRAGSAEAEVVGVPALLEKVRDRMQPAVEAAGGRLTLAPAAGRCRIDPARLEEALANLVENSVKYRHPRRALAVTIGARVAGDTVAIEVRDNGLGIDPVHHQRIFQPLFRLEGGVGQGSGLGLYIVRRIVEEAGGRVSVDSAPDAETTMRLELPAAGEEADRVHP